MLGILFGFFYQKISIITASVKFVYIERSKPRV